MSTPVSELFDFVIRQTQFDTVQARTRRERAEAQIKFRLANEAVKVLQEIDLEYCLHTGEQIVSGQCTQITLEDAQILLILSSAWPGAVGYRKEWNAAAWS